MDERKSFDELVLMSPNELGKILVNEIIKRDLDTQYVIDLIYAGALTGITHSVGGMTPIQYAAYRGYVDVIKAMIETGVSLEAKDDKRWSPLRYAIREGHVEVVKALIAAGANIEIYDPQGQTPLHWAIETDNIQVIQILLAAGASKEVPDHNGNTPWDLATFKIRKAVPELNPDYNE